MNNVENISRYSRRIVQYFWDPEPKNDDDSTAVIWCLGRKYETYTAETTADTGTKRDDESRDSRTTSLPAPKEQNASHSSSEDPAIDSSFETVDHGDATSNAAREWPPAFLDDFESRVWMTYRTGFPTIPRSDDASANSKLSLSVRLKNQLGSASGFTSDTGWGCMIRSGQCVLANALAIHRLGRDWRRGSRGDEEKRLLSLFADDPRAPFSIHRFVEHGAKACGTYPGQWFGPSATARCIQALSHQYTDTGLRVYITGDGPDIFVDSLFATAKGNTSTFQPTLLLVGTRLGIDRVTPAYWPALRASLQMDQSIGIAGGRPSASHYFVGSQGSSFFYLDPHQPRPALPLHNKPENYTIEQVDSCHTRRLRRVALEQMDPSMLIAFLFRDEEDWNSWRTAITKLDCKAIVHFRDSQQSATGSGMEREAALDEVETFDDEEYEGGKHERAHTIPTDETED